MTTIFFKVIRSTEPKLRIPHKFVRKYRESMPSLVSLDCPNGPAFQVELTTSDGEIWLQKGFKQFMDYYSIKPGDLLVFNCDFEGSFFHVTNQLNLLTSSNGKHPEKVSNKSCCLREEKEVVSGKCIDCLYDMLSEVQRKRRISRRKKSEASPKKEVSDGLEKDKYYEVSDSSVNEISRKPEKAKLETAHERAKAFISTRTSMVRFMHRSYVKRLSMNKLFAQKLIKEKKACNVKLRVPGCRREWTAKCTFARDSARLYWSTFVHDNGLCVGDACVLELGNDITPSLNVIIFRSTEETEFKG